MVVYHKFRGVSGPSSVALGFFDGVHIAHQKVIRQIVGQAGMTPTVLTFRLDGAAFKGNAEMILTDDQRVAYMEKLGVERVFLPVFEEISEMEADVFLNDVLKKMLHAQAVSCGYDYTFGRDAKGNAALLTAFCKENGITLTVLPPMRKGKQLISSTAIRQYLTEGRIEEANELLGRPYQIEGKILHGRELGRTLGFPTINQHFKKGQVVLKSGVYQSTAVIDQKEYKSITDIGIKPTIPGKRQCSAETHLIGAAGDFYGKTAVVSLQKMMRPERRFDDIASLKNAVLHDIAARRSE